MANDKESAPVTNFGMGLYAFPQQRMSKEEEHALFLRSLKGELSPQEEWLYRQYQMNSPPTQDDWEPVPHRYGEQEFIEQLRKEGRLIQQRRPSR